MSAVVLWPTEDAARAFPNLAGVVTQQGLGAAVIRGISVRLGSLANSIPAMAQVPGDVLYRTCGVALVITTQGVPGIAAVGSPGADGYVAEVPPLPECNRNLTPIEVAQVGSVWRICRRIVFMHNGKSWLETEALDVDPMVEPPPPATQQQLQQWFPPQAPAALPKHKFSAFLDQGDETEFLEAENVVVQGWHANFVADAQVRPPRQERASTLQLSAMFHKVVTLGRSPYANFATLCPYEEKMTRYNKFAVDYVVNGEHRIKEQPGPASFSEWIGCFRIFCTIMRSLHQGIFAALVAYERRIEQLNRDYPDCWGLIYLAEDTMRMEEFPLILERLTMRAQQSPAYPPSLWDPNAPWSAVILEAAENPSYWAENVVVPANRWLASGRAGRAEQLHPDTRLARRLLPGGTGALITTGNHSRKRGRSRSMTPEKRKRSGSRKRQAKKRKSKRGRSPPPPRERSQKRKSARKERSRSRGREPDGPRKSLDSQICFAFSKRFGKCAKAKEGSKCDSGRKHACHVCGGNHAAKDKGCKPAGKPPD